MRIASSLFLITTLVAVSAGRAGAQAQDAPAAIDRMVVPVWPDGAPGAKGGAGAPSRLTIYAPVVDRANGTAVVVCPGGAYRFLATEREGVQYAQWLATLGVTAFVLEYRLGDAGTFAPLQDVLRAVRIVRSRAAEFRIRPDRIGVMGSSAGGHLAASAGTLYQRPEGRGGGPLDEVSGRPDFLILMYPVIPLTNPESGSRYSLLGENPAPELVELLSPDRQVTKTTPPTLLIHAQDDELAPVENSILFYQALTRAGVPAEMYLFERGGHGLGLQTALGAASDWPRRAEEWLRGRRLLAAPAR